MIKLLLCDFSWTLLHPKDRNYAGSINGLNKTLGGGNPFGTYDFFQYFVLNTELLDAIATFKKTFDLKTCLFTTDIIQERPEIKDDLARVFDRIISGHEIVKEGLANVNDLNSTKTNNKSYEYVARTMQCRPDQMVFIDDTAQNLTAASSAGVRCIHYSKAKSMHEANKEAIRQIERILTRKA